MATQLYGIFRGWPIKRAVDAYNAAFKATGTLPESNNSLTWDSALIVLDALRKYGLNATAAQIHDDIESLHDWIGIGDKWTVMIRWDPARNAFVGISKPGGVPL